MSEDGSTEITDSIFAGNYAFLYGGAIYADDVLRVIGTTFSGNIAENEGGGGIVWGNVLSSSQIRSLELDRVRFLQNRGDSGGGLFINDSLPGINESVWIRNSEFSGNAATGRIGSGGGISSVNGPTLVITNSSSRAIGSIWRSNQLSRNNSPDGRVPCERTPPMLVVAFTTQLELLSQLFHRTSRTAK